MSDGTFEANGQPGAAPVAQLYAVVGDNQVWASARVLYLGAATASGDGSPTYARSR